MPGGDTLAMATPACAPMNAAGVGFTIEASEAFNLKELESMRHEAALGRAGEAEPKEP